MFKKIKRFICIIVIIFLALLACFIHSGYDMYKEAITKTSLEDMVESIKSDEDYVEIDEVSQDFLNAIIAIEDKRFYSHFGIDILGIGRAFLSNLESGNIVGGGSTITQQLAKNMYFEQEQQFSRKIAEVFVSLDLEENYEKDEILELYINYIYYGDGYYGIREASLGYFQKEPSELSLYEASLLAGIPNAPSVYSLSNNSEYTYQRQELVLEAMVSEGYITQAEMDEVLNEI